MTVSIECADGAIRVETGELELRVDRALAIDVVSRRHPTRLRGLRARAHVDGAPLAARDLAVIGDGEMRTRLGVATRVQLRAVTGRGVDLLLAIETAEGWPGVVLELGLENRGDAPVRVAALELGCDEPGQLVLSGGGALRLYRMGYQSWSPAGWIRPGTREPRPRLSLVRRVICAPGAPRPVPGLHVSDFATSLRAPGHAGLTLGFLTHERFLSRIELDARGGGVAALRARVATEQRVVPPRGSLAGERLWVGLDPPGADGIAGWAERAGREMSAPVPAPVGSGWCTWYHFFGAVRAADVLRNVGELAEFAGQLETVQIDDGYQAAVGDWLEFDPSFPDGVEPLARAIRAAGFRAGLWLAPFLASRASRLARDHPQWLLRGRDGRPLLANLNPAWRGRVCYALDVTHPDVLEHLRRVFRTLRSWGFDYFKLDFLYAGALEGARRDPSQGSAEGYRNAVRAIREGAGDGALLLGCGAPLGPSIGLFEAMRIGPDVAPYWRARWTDFAYGVPAAPSAENSIRNALARASLHQRLWINDPDCALLRDRRTRLTPREVQTLAAVIATSGGLVTSSDDLACTSGERRALLRRLLPPSGRAPEIPAGDAEIPSRLFVSFPDGSVLWLAVNLGPRSERVRVEPASLGLAPPVRVYDVLADRDLGEARDVFEPAPLPPRAAALLRITPADLRPGVVGSSLHWSAGALEVARLRTSSAAGAELRLQLPGPREGRVIVTPGAGPAVPVHVRFSDSLDLEVRGALEEPPGIHDH